MEPLHMVKAVAHAGTMSVGYPCMHPVCQKQMPFLVKLILQPPKFIGKGELMQSPPPNIS